MKVYATLLKNCKMMPFCGAPEENSYITIDDRLYTIKVVYSVRVDHLWIRVDAFSVVVFVVVFFLE